ncbi:SDR family NAD(P)-dependent oxidoreductase [Pseudohalioglobus sediminis]|uniref:SDR family NAD(P)-dependent oxidoreductase n=1 Tax=Pseudohalioglobus sediminis TaxID=2606449 RepID=A0A5B0X4A3_9GAMM|nr:SDR family NAD(P)-dependent oxidoreductase [Pseudohalioglobus sediminis]KAA1194083.1 SDR family NAD(P)-dependent oxidoreductase [Pseudohalioglobus sediminis]
MTDQQQVVFISGGGSGIGLFLARHFFVSGARVAVFDLSLSAAVREEIDVPGNSGNSVFHEVDVRDTRALEMRVSEACSALGAPTLAVNCAGVQIAGTFADLSAEQFSRVLDTNLLGSRNFAAAVLPHMRQHGRLALVASLAGLVPNYAYSAYSASKYGVVGLAGALRMECLPRAIHVSVICPPEVSTPMVEREMQTMDPITRELKLAAGTLDLDTACREILVGLQRGDFLIIPGSRARMIDRLNRWFPGLLRRKADKIILSMAGGT